MARPAPDLAERPNPDMTFAPAPGSHPPGSECDDERECDGIAPPERYCATDIADGKGYCVDAASTGPGAYHVSWGRTDLPGQVGYSSCSMSGFPVLPALPQGAFLCGNFSVR